MVRRQTSARSSRSAARPSPSRRTTTSSPSRRRCCARVFDGGGRRRRSRTSGSSSPRGSARTSRSSARGASRRRAARRSRTYVHPPANKVGVLVRTKGGDPAAARSLAMHIDVRAPDLRLARRGAAGARRRRARDPRRSCRRGRVEAGERPREDRRGHAEQALLRRGGARRSRRGSATTSRLDGRARR